MLIELSAESERLVEREIASGRFHSIDEIIEQGVRTRKQETEEEAARRQQHRLAIEWTREFAKSRAVHLDAVTIKELIEEGRRS